MTKPHKNPAAVALGSLGAKAQPVEFKRLGGKLRWHGLTKDERSKIMRTQAKLRKATAEMWNAGA